MPLLTLRQFRETGLGDMTSDANPEHDSQIDELVSLLRDNIDKLLPHFHKLLMRDIDPDAEAALKKLIVLVQNLRERPEVKKDKRRDPLSNVVARPLQGPDGPGGDLEGGGQ